MKGIHHISKSEVCSIIFFLGKICVVCDTEKWIFFSRKQETLESSFFFFYPKIKLEMLLEYKKTVYVLRFPHWMPLSNLASTANLLYASRQVERTRVLNWWNLRANHNLYCELIALLHTVLLCSVWLSDDVLGFDSLRHLRLVRSVKLSTREGQKGG